MRAGFILAAVAAVSIADTALAAPACPNATTVDTVELPHYLGRWYEIASNEAFKQGFEKGLECTTANYSMNADGTIKVVNGGRVGSPTGKLSQAVGKAKQVKGGKLEVSFFGPFYGPYWITQLYGEASAGYEVSVVYSCSSSLFGEIRDMWILSRTPKLPAALPLDGLYAKAKGMGIDVAALNMTLTTQTSTCIY